MSDPIEESKNHIPQIVLSDSNREREFFKYLYSNVFLSLHLIYHEMKRYFATLPLKADLFVNSILHLCI